MRARSVPSNGSNRFRLLVGVFGLLVAVVNANFNDYVDSTYNCPATTTCPQVCVAAKDACPDDMKCSSDDKLCIDGSCISASDVCASNLNNPCEYACAPTACARVVIDAYDFCLEKYKPEYEAHEVCRKTEEEAIVQNSFRRGVVIFFYLWLVIMTLTIGIWCAYNQRWRFLAESASIQSLDEADGKAVNWQSGCQTVLTGNLIYYCTVMTLFGFQVVLTACTISYYIHQDKERASVDPVFDNERQVLQAFEVTWMLGFLWSYALKWPYSIRSLFYQRCALGEATHVSVLVPYDDDVSQSAVDDSKGTKYVVNIQRRIQILFSLVNRCMAFLFSERAREAGKVEYCSVETDTDRTRYFVFNFRRYNYDDVSCKFAPGAWHAANTIGDFDKMRTGLAANEVEKRRRVVGPNSIEMKPPSLLRSISEEFTKPFYTYQNYMVWTWLPLWYYYMALIHGSVILTGGLAVSLFRYRNDKNLYKLSYISGHVDALRDGAMVSIPQKELVPGDVVVVTSGNTYCDMVLVSSHGVLVDESALTGESNPVAKTAVDSSDGAKKYDPLTHKRHSISAGTSILESEGHQNLAVVTSTGSFTTKGELLRSIFAYQRYQFKFDVEVGLVIGILFFYAIFGFAMVVYFIKDTPTYAWFYGMQVSFILF
jgi:magnesium-transporting ATPase (P-type)